MAEDPVLPQRRLEQQAVAVAVLGNVGDAALAALARVPAGDVTFAEHDASRLGSTHAHDRLDELGLPVALDSGQPDDLALVDDEADVVDDRAAVQPCAPSGLDR